jgi:hypothetical protein
MRPLERTVNNKNYKDYHSYEIPLRDAFGDYCAYCEKKDAGLEIDHVVPHSKGGGFADWNNLLRVCSACNQFKKAKNTSRMRYAFPDTDETFAIFHYHSDSRIEGVTSEARATIVLCGLNYVKGQCDRYDAQDARLDAFKKANKAKKLVQTGKLSPDDAMVFFAGCWSVWMTVFYDVPAMIALLSDPRHFPGTRKPIRFY